MNILITGFGPFPGAPFNPTGRLVRTLARSRRLTLTGAHVTAHVFATSYAAVDRELPALLARTQPDVLLMFGLAARSRRLRIETRARNVLGRTIPDAAGATPKRGVIAPATVATTRPLHAPFQEMVIAARRAGVEAAPSRDAGRYLCNYLCWRATEARVAHRRLKVAAFVHVPQIDARLGPRRIPLTFQRLVRAGEAIARATIRAARTGH